MTVSNNSVNIGIAFEHETGNVQRIQRVNKY